MDRHIDPMVIDMPAPNELSGNRETSMPILLDKLLLVGIIAISVWGPLAFGTTEVWSQFIQRILVCSLVAVWMIKQAFQRAVEFPKSSIFLPLAAFGIFVAVQFLFGWTAHRRATIDEALNLIAYGGLVLVAADLFVRRRHLRTFVTGMAWFGAALAVFSILHGFSGSDQIYGFRKVTAVSADIFGPYANHNHYAGLMELLTPLAIAAALLEDGARRTILLFASVLMAVSIVLSRSRGGIIAMLIAAIFVSVTLYRSFGQRRGALVMAGLFATVVGLALMLSTDKMVSRVAVTADAYRMPIAIDSVRLVSQKPIIGYGLGTFADVYPRSQSFFSNLLVNHAHNDYLEILVETGIVGFSLIVWMLIAVFRSGMKKVGDKADTDGRLLILAAMTGIVAILSHSFLDFNLHIPANAALFFLLCSAVATPFKHQMKPIEFGSPGEFETEFTES